MSKLDLRMNSLLYSILKKNYTDVLHSRCCICSYGEEIELQIRHRYMLSNEPTQKESHNLFYQQNFFNFLNQWLGCNLIILLLYFCIELLKGTNDVSRNIEMKNILN